MPQFQAMWQRIPNELFYHIVEATYCSRDTKTLATLCRLNHFLNHIATRCLYDYISVSRRTTLRKLARTLNSHPTLFDRNRFLFFHDRLWEENTRTMVQRIFTYIHGHGNLQVLAYPICQESFFSLWKPDNFASLQRLAVNAVIFNEKAEVDFLLSLPSLVQLAVAITFVTLPLDPELRYLGGMVRYFSDPRAAKHVVLGIARVGMDPRRQQALIQHLHRLCPRMAENRWVVWIEYGPGTGLSSAWFWDQVINEKLWTLGITP
jgi:hypothetical protein